MKNKYWFKPKCYVYGFTPITREGWLATGALVVLILMSFFSRGIYKESVGFEDGLGFLFDVFVLCIIFTIAMQDKVNGELKWRWGGKKKEEHKSEYEE